MNIITSKKKLSEKTNKIDVHFSNEHPDIKMNFNTLQYLHILEQNEMNNIQNIELLSLLNSKNDLFGLC